MLSGVVCVRVHDVLMQVRRLSAAESGKVRTSLLEYPWGIWKLTSLDCVPFFIWASRNSLRALGNWIHQ